MKRAGEPPFRHRGRGASKVPDISVAALKLTVSRIRHLVLAPDMANRKKGKSAKGRRYTAEEKARIIEHVEKVNASKGRGGQTAASKKFGISMLTISSWMKKTPGTPTRAAGGKKSLGGALTKLAGLHSQIEAKEKELAKLRKQFDAIKKSL